MDDYKLAVMTMKTVALTAVHHVRTYGAVSRDVAHRATMMIADTADSLLAAPPALRPLAAQLDVQKHQNEVSSFYSWADAIKARQNPQFSDLVSDGGLDPRRHFDGPAQPSLEHARAEALEEAAHLCETRAERHKYGPFWNSTKGREADECADDIRKLAQKPAQSLARARAAFEEFLAAGDFRNTGEGEADAWATKSTRLQLDTLARALGYADASQAMMV